MADNIPVTRRAEAPKSSPLSAKLSQFDYSPVQVGDIYKESQYTPRVFVQELPDLETRRAELQPWQDKLGNGLANMTSSAFTGALESTVGLAYGAGSALISNDTSKFYDNEFGRTLDSMNNYVRETNPFYYSEAEKNASLLGSMGYQNFWFDKVLGGAGYTVGSLLAGYGMGKVFQMGKTARLAQLSDELGQATKAGQELSAAALKHAQWDMGKQIALGGVMAHGESSMEARQTFDSTVDNLTKLRDQALDPDTDVETKLQLAQYVNLTDEKIKDMARSAADTNYLANMAVTGPTDMLLLGKFINPGKRSAMRTYNELGKRTTIEGATQYFDKVVTKKGRSLLNGAESFLKGFATEGGQEGAQFASNIAAQEFVEMHGVQGGDWWTSLTTGMGEGLSETFTSREGLESVLVGGLVGGPFGMKGARGERLAQDARTKTLVDALNADPNFTQANPKVNGFLAAMNAANKSEDFLKNNDLFNAKNAADQALNHYIKTQIDLGTTDYFVEKLQGIKEMEQEERDKYFGPGTTPEQIDQVIEKVAKLNELNESIETLYGTPGGTPEEKAYNEILRKNLFFAASTIKDVEGRVKSIEQDLTGLGQPEIQNILALRDLVKSAAKGVKVEEMSDEGKALVKSELESLSTKIEKQKEAGIPTQQTEEAMTLLQADPEKYFKRKLTEKTQIAQQYGTANRPGSMEMKDVEKAAKELDAIVMKKSFVKEPQVPEGMSAKEYAMQMRDQAIESYNDAVKEFVTNNPVEGNKTAEMLADLNQLDNRRYQFVEFYNELNDPELATKRIAEQKVVMDQLTKMTEETAKEQQEIDALSKLNLEALDNIVNPNTRRENIIKYNNTDTDLSKMEEDALEELRSTLRVEATDARIEGAAEEADALAEMANKVEEELEFRKKTQELIDNAKDALAKATTPEQIDALVKTLVDSGYFTVNPEEVAKIKENVAKKAAINNSIQQRIERKINPMFRGADEFYLSFTDGNAQMKSQFAEAISRKDAEKRIYLKIKPNVDSAGNSLAGKVSRIGKGETMNTRVQNVSPRFVVEIWSQGSATEGDVHIGYMRWPGQYADANGLPLNIQDLTGTGDPVKNEEMYRLLFEPDESQGARSYNDFKNAHSKLEQTFKQLEGIYNNPVNKGKPEIVLSTAKTAELVNVSITKGNYSIENTEVPLVDFLKEDTATPPLIMDGTPVIVSTSTYDGSSNVFYTKRNNSTENPNAITTQTKVASVMNDKGNPVLFDPTTVVEGGTRPEFIPALEKLREILSSPKIGETIYNKYWMLVYDPQGSITIEGMEGKFDWRPMTSRSLNNDERNNIFQKVNELRALLNTIDPNLPPQQSVKDALKELNNSFFMALQSSDVAKNFKNISIGFTGSPAEGLGLKIDFRTLGGEQLDQLVDEQGNVTKVMSYKGEIYMNIPSTVQSFEDLIVWLNDQMQRPQQVRWEVRNQDKPTRRQMAPLSTKLAPVTLSNLRVNFVGEPSAAGGEINKGLSAVTPENVYDSFSTNVSRTTPRTNRRLRLEPTAKAAIAAPSPSVQPVTTATAPTVTQPPVTVAPPAQPQIISLAPGLTSGEGEAVPAQQPSLESVMQMVSKYGLIRKMDISGKPETWTVIDVINLSKEERDVIKDIVAMTASTKEELLEKIKQKYSTQGAAPVSTDAKRADIERRREEDNKKPSRESVKYKLQNKIAGITNPGPGNEVANLSDALVIAGARLSTPVKINEGEITHIVFDQEESAFRFTFKGSQFAAFYTANARGNVRWEIAKLNEQTGTYQAISLDELKNIIDKYGSQRGLLASLGMENLVKDIEDFQKVEYSKEDKSTPNGIISLENTVSKEQIRLGKKYGQSYTLEDFLRDYDAALNPSAPITPTAPTRRGRNMTAEEAKKAGNKPGPVRSIGRVGSKVLGTEGGLPGVGGVTKVFRTTGTELAKLGVAYRGSGVYYAIDAPFQVIGKEGKVSEVQVNIDPEKTIDLTTKEGQKIFESIQKEAKKRFDALPQSARGVNTFNDFIRDIAVERGYNGAISWIEPGAPLNAKLKIGREYVSYVGTAEVTPTQAGNIGKLKNMKLSSEERIKLEDAFARLSKILPSWITAEEMAPLLDNWKQGRVTFGSFFNNVIKLSRLAPSGTELHEAFHAVFRALLTDKQQDALYKEAKDMMIRDLKKQGKSFLQGFEKFKKERPDYTEKATMTEEQLKALYIEEWMADEFARQSKQKKTKQAAREARKGTIASLWDQFMDLVDRIFRFFTGQKQLTRLFQDIDAGRFKAAEKPVINRFSRDPELNIEARSAIQVGYKEGMDGSVHAAFLDPEYQNRFVNTIASTVLERLNLPESMGSIASTMIDEEMQKLGETFAFANYPEIDFNNPDPSVMDKVELLDDFNFLLNDTSDEAQQARNKFKQEILLKLKELNVNEFDSAPNEDYDGSEDITERSFDLNNENKGGFKSLSKALRKYIGTTTYTTTLDEFLGLEPGSLFGEKTITTAVDPKRVYNGLVKITANQADPSGVIKKMNYYRRTPGESTEFINKFFEEAGIVFDENGDFTYNAAKTVLVQRVVKGFNLFEVNYLFTGFSPGIPGKNKPDTKTYSANRKGMDMQQVESWSQRYGDLLVRRGKERMQNLASDFSVALLTSNLVDKVTNQPRALTNDEVSQFARETRQKLLQLGISLSEQYLEYIVLADPNKIKTPDQFKFVQEFSGSVKLSAAEVKKSLDVITGSLFMSQGINPYEKGTVVDGEGAVTRLLKIAADNAVFDETVVISTMTNAEGKNIYPYQKASYHVQKIYELQNIDLNDPDVLEQIQKEKPNSDFLVGNRLLANETFRTMLSNLAIERIDGMRQMEIDENGKASSKKTANEGVTYGKMTKRELALAIYSMFADSSTDATTLTTNPEGKLISTKAAVRRTLFNILEASNTADVLKLPVTNYLDQNGRITDEFKQAYLAEIKREYDRIERVRNNGYVDQYNKFNAFAKEEDQRGRKFWDTKEMLDSIDGGALRRQLETGEISFEEAIPAIIKQMDPYFRNELKKNIDNLKEIGVLNEDGTNRLLPKKYEGGSSEDTMFGPIMQSNIHNAYLNDLMNSMAINQILMGDPALSLKNNVDWFKRARGNNASGDNMLGIDANKNAKPVRVVTMGTLNDKGELDDFYNEEYKVATRIYKIGSPEYEKYRESLSPEERKDFDEKKPKQIAIADAQAYTTVRGMGRIMESLGRMTPEGFEIYKKIGNNEKLTEKEWDYLRTHDLMLNSQKLVYYDGVTYVKMSVAVLSPDYTSDKNGNPRPGMEFLDNMRRNMQEKDIDLLGPPSMMKKMIKNPYIVDPSNPDFDIQDSNVQLLDKGYLRLQQENPSNKTYIKDPTQQQNIITAEQSSAPVEFPWNSNIKTGRDLVAYYDKLLAERVKTTYVPARNFLLALKNNKWTLDLKRATRAFRKTLEETGASPQVLAYLEVDENGYPIYNLNAPNIVKEFEQHFNAYFNKVLSQKVPGYKTTLQSGFMHRVLEDTQTGKIISTIEYDADPSKYSDRNRYKPRRLAFDVPRIINGKEVHRYSEVVIPFHFAEQFGLKPGDAIPEEIAYLFGTRIPSQDKHSALVLKIVDVLPPHYGSNMIAPDELVLLTGSDFDVDSFFNQRVDHYVKDGKFKAYGNNEDSKWDQFKMWHRANNRLVKDLMEEMEGDLEFKRTLKQLKQPLIEADLASERVSELGMAGEGYDALTEREKQVLAEKPENLEAYKRAKKIIDDLRNSNFIKALKILGLPSTEAEFSKSDLRTIGEINNDILNARMVLHSNPAMNDINKTPATIDPIEEALDTFAKALGYTRWQEMNTAFSPNSINGKLEAFETNKAGQTAIGASVNNTNNFSIISRFGIQKSENEKNPVQDVIIEGKDPNDPIVVGTISPEIFVTEDNKRIMDVNSTLTSSMTDNTKYGYNSKLNLDIETLSVVSMLVMNRVRLYDALRLVNSQYVVKYLKDSQQFAIQSTSEEMAKKEVDTDLIKELIKKARDASGGTLTNEEISKAARGPVTQNDLRLVVLHNPRSKMLSKMSINERNEYYKNLDSQEYYDYLMAELRILNAYLTISKKHSPEFIAFSQIVKLTKGIASSTKETSFKGDEDLRNYLKTLNLKLVETKDGWRVDYGDAKPEELPLYDFKNILNNHLISLANLSVFADKTEAQKNYFISQTSFAEKLRTLINKGLKKRMKNKIRTKAMTQLRRDMESFLMIRAWRNSLPENERENLNNYLYNHIAEKNGVKSLVDLKQELLRMYPHLEKNLMFTQVFFKNDGEGVLSKVETNTRTKGNKGFEGMIMSAVRSMANNEGYPLINAMIKHLIAKNGLQFKNESPVGLLAPSIYGNEFPFSQLMDSYTDMLNTLDDASFKEMFGMTPVELMEEFQELFMLDINNRDYITKLTEGRTLKNPILEKAKTSPVTVTETGFTVDFDKGVQNKKNVPIYDEQGNIAETIDTSEDDKGQRSINFKVMDAFQFTKRNKNEKIGDKEKSVVVFDFPKFIQIGMQKYKLKEYVPTGTRYAKPEERFSSKPNEDGEYLGIAATYEKMDTLGYFGVSVIGRTVAEANEVTFDQISKMIKNKKNGGETLETAEENSQIADEIDEGDVSITSNIPSEPIQVVNKPTTTSKTYEGKIKTLGPNQIFVFGSNPEGRHGLGTAQLAKNKFGAVYGQGRGLQGQSYGLVTKNLTPGFKESSTGITYEKAGEKSLSPQQIIENIDELYQTAMANPTKEFMVAYTVDRNLNGYTPQEMANMFNSLPIPNNVIFNREFKALFTSSIPSMSKQDQQVQKNIQALSATAVTAGAADTVAKDLLKFSLVSKGVAAIQAMYMKMYAAAGLDMSKLPAIFAKLAKTGILSNKSATNDQFKDVVEKVVNEATVEEVNEMNQKLC